MNLEVVSVSAFGDPTDALSGPGAYHFRIYHDGATRPVPYDAFALNVADFANRAFAALEARQPMSFGASSLGPFEYAEPCGFRRTSLYAVIALTDPKAAQVGDLVVQSAIAGREARVEMPIGERSAGSWRTLERREFVLETFRVATEDDVAEMHFWRRSR